RRQRCLAESQRHEGHGRDLRQRGERARPPRVRRPRRRRLARALPPRWAVEDGQHASARAVARRALAGRFVLSRARRGFATAALTTSCLLACQVIVGVREEEGAPRPADAGSGAVTDADGPSDPCIKHVPPPPPPGPPATDDVDARYFALRSFAFRPPNQPAIGYDLDQRCTGLAASTTSDPPCVMPSPDEADDDGGVDNAFGRLLDLLPGAFKSDSGDFAGEAFDFNVGIGRFTILV